MSDQSTPLEILQMQEASNIAKEVSEELASKSTYSYLYYGSLTLLVLSLIAGAAILTVILVKNKKKKKNKLLQWKNFRKTEMKKLLPFQERETVKKQNSVSEVKAKNPVDLLVKETRKDDLNEDPLPAKSVKFKRELNAHDIFPTHDIKENSEEANYAKQYSYENLQDSMFARQLPKPQRKVQSSVWDSNVQIVKEEIEKSGQSLEQYMSNTNAPLPETLMEAWKSPKIPKKLGDSYTSNVPKYAEKEMPSLVVDATQQIPMDGKTMAYDAMQDILKAKKRAKVLGVKLPDASKEQKAAIKKWMSSDVKEMKDLATSLNTFM